MKENYLESILKELFYRAEINKGFIEHLENDLNRYLTSELPKVQKSLKQFYGDQYELAPVKFSAIVISDLTENNEDGLEFVYPTGTLGYLVRYLDYEPQNRILLNKISNLLMAQTYEALEKYIKDIIIQYFIANNSMGETTIGKLNLRYSNNSIDWNKTIRDIKSRNNDTFLNIIRIISPEFELAELKNNRNINLKYLMPVFSTARHAITHSDSIIEMDFINGLQSEGKKILDDYFICEKTNDQKFEISLSPNGSTQIMQLICEYAFLIFKCLSIEAKLDWRILQDMKNTTEHNIGS